MKIVFKQQKKQGRSLERFGVSNCYLKKLTQERDASSIMKKAHHHTGFEIHILTDGYQEYEINGRRYRLERDSFLLIAPNVTHAVAQSAPLMQKYSITFEREVDIDGDCFIGALTERMSDNLKFISDEISQDKEISLTLIENNILEIIVSVFRLWGIKEKESKSAIDEDSIIALAKQYIKDNIDLLPSVEQVVKYCYLSAKQLTRKFRQFENISPGEYIAKKRVEKIEKMLADDEISLAQISEIMHFSNEYYFNAFFKRNSGMPPGKYRKMIGK